MSYHAGDPEKAKVLMLAPTGVAAVNVAGATIHSALGIPVGNFCRTIPKLNDKKDQNYELIYLQLRLFSLMKFPWFLTVSCCIYINDSQVNHLELVQFRVLVHILLYVYQYVIAGISIIALGDLYQLL